MKRESAHPSTKFLVWFHVVCVSLCLFYEHVSRCWYFVLFGRGVERRREEVLRKMFWVWVWVWRCQIFLLRVLIRNLLVFGIQIFISIPILLTTLLILVGTFSRHFQPIFIRSTVLFSSVPSRTILPILLTTSFSAPSRFLSSTTLCSETAVFFRLSQREWFWDIWVWARVTGNHGWSWSKSYCSSFPQLTTM